MRGLQFPLTWDRERERDWGALANYNPAREGSTVAHGTLIDWYNFCREVSEDVVINNSEKIGGFGITVEIDESKYGKISENEVIELCTSMYWITHIFKTFTKSMDIPLTPCTGFPSLMHITAFRDVASWVLNCIKSSPPQDINAPIPSDAFRLLRNSVMPSNSSSSSSSSTSSERVSAGSRRSRRSNRDRGAFRDQSRSRSPLWNDRHSSPRDDHRSKSRFSVAEREKLQSRERLERDRRERSRERLERIVEEERGKLDQPGDRQEEPKKQLKFTVARERMKIFRDWMTSSLSAPEARSLRDSFIPKFSNTSFDLVCPQVDSSFSRRFKELKTPEMAKAEATERSLKAEQYKILDVARPLLFLREEIAASAELKDSPLAEAAETALRLWGHTFHNVTVSRRENLLRVSDPKFLSLLKEPNRLKPRECASLFGRRFIRNMVKEATDDQTLRSISRMGGSHSSSSRYRAGNSGYRGASNSRRGGGFGHGGHSGNYDTSANTFNRSRGNHSSFRSENLLCAVSPLDSPPIVGGRLRHFVESWKTLSKDPWILQSISQGVKLDFWPAHIKLVAKPTWKWRKVSGSFVIEKLEIS
ncbi:hypothetical protein OUZ56_009560 [Daphnia magna]|uniref:Uncharacterized protein n=1 Tax=Daphnia magna TaxID=35525 RepID=A0ABR0AGI7_9CRUS|nr:hypothetical protein OUZ56_009560 [Daphnia magna]